MRKYFGGAFALILVALFTVAPTSPATAAGGIHLHMAGNGSGTPMGPLVWNFTIGADGTFTAIGPACDGTMIDGQCSQSPPMDLPDL